MKMVDEIIKVVTNEKGDKLASARDLHEYVESKERFSKWWDRNISYGFIEGLDYAPYQKVHPQNKQIIQDFVMKLDMAKEVSMIQRSDKGKQARTYFIEVDKASKRELELYSYMINDPIKRAEKWIEEYQEKQLLELTVAEQKKEIELQSPKVESFDMFINAKNNQKMNDVAKSLGIGRNKLFALLREKGILMSDNVPYQRYINDKYFVVKQYSTMVNEGYLKNVTQTFVTAKGVEYIGKLLREDDNIKLNSISHSN